MGPEPGAQLPMVAMRLSDEEQGNLHQVTVPSTGVPENAGRYPSYVSPRCPKQQQSAVASFRMVS
ncbi:hypothetical protein [Streptomyces cyaneofuscatus]|uniref:hypothetical protein n=1 Tax=Streptomyces cyaneofuscatus TaxID=66883 RepID=UPI00343617FD